MNSLTFHTWSLSVGQSRRWKVFLRPSTKETALSISGRALMASWDRLAEIARGERGREGGGLQKSSSSVSSILKRSGEGELGGAGVVEGEGYRNIGVLARLVVPGAVIILPVTEVGVFTPM